MMKLKALLAVSFALSALIAPQAFADLTFSNLNVTANSFTVDISGTVPSGAAGDPSLLVVESNPLSTSPGWVIGPEFANAVTYSFSGSQALTQLTTGSPVYGDYIYFRFNPILSTGDTLAGTLTGTWAMDVFDPAAIGSVDVYWGALSSSGSDKTLVASGIENDTVSVPAVPVPALSTYGLILIALVLLMVASRRLRA